MPFFTSSEPFCRLNTLITVAVLNIIASFSVCHGKHVAPHYDIPPAITEEQIIELGEQANDETLIKDETKKELIQEHKQNLSRKGDVFRSYLTRAPQEPDTLDSIRPRPLVGKEALAPLPDIFNPEMADRLSKTSEDTDKASKATINEQDNDVLSGRPSVKSTSSSLALTNEQIQLTAKPSLVFDYGDGNIEIDQNFEQLTPTLIRMNRLSYAIGKRGTLEGKYDALIDTLTKQFADEGWQIRQFTGKTGKGNRIDDIPGFVAYNAEKNTMTIILRGSQTREDDVGSPDWQVNFDAKHIPFPFGGTVHRGYYNRMLSIMPQLERAMRGFFEAMTIEQKQNLRIIGSGHSQGAGLMSIALPLIAEVIKAGNWLGPDFENTRDRVIQGYLLSSPRVFSGDDALAYYNDTIGKQQTIRQQVVGRFLSDPVPLVTPGRTLTSLIRLVPIIGDRLADKYGGDTGNKSLGFLAADWSEDTIRRGVIQNLRGRAKSEARNFLDLSLERIDYIVKHPMILFKPKTTKTLFSDLIKQAKSSLMIVFAPLHYGAPSEIEDGQYLFGEELILSNRKTMAELIQQGFEEKRRQHEGLSGAVRKAIENMARAKGKLPTLASAYAGVKTAPTKIASTFRSAFSGFKRKLFGR